MTVIRVLLILAGLVSLGAGALALLDRLDPLDLIWLAVWLAAMVIVHDAVIVPFLVLLRGAVRRRSDHRGVPALATVVVEVAFAIAATVSLYVIPLLWSQARGPKNPTVLAGDYGLRLGLLWLILTVLTLVLTRVLIRRFGKNLGSHVRDDG